MTESPEYAELAGSDEPEAQIPDPSQFDEPEDLVEEDFEDDHAKEEVGGPGGIVNYPEELAPDGWVYEEGESTPKEES